MKNSILAALALSSIASGQTPVDQKQDTVEQKTNTIKERSGVIISGSLSADQLKKIKLEQKREEARRMLAKKMSKDGSNYMKWIGIRGDIDIGRMYEDPKTKKSVGVKMTFTRSEKTNLESGLVRLEGVLTPGNYTITFGNTSLEGKTVYVGMHGEGKSKSDKNIYTYGEGGEIIDKKIMKTGPSFDLIVPANGGEYMNVVIDIQIFGTPTYGTEAFENFKIVPKKTTD